MPRTLTEAEQQDFLAQPHVGVLSVPGDDGRPPHTSPVWYAYQPGGNLTFFSGTQGRKAQKVRLLERAGKLSFCVQQPQFPFRYVTVECTVVEANRKPAIDDVVAVAGRYLPEDVARGFAEGEVNNPTGTFVLFSARPDRWMSFDFGAE